MHDNAMMTMTVWLFWVMSLQEPGWTGRHKFTKESLRDWRSQCHKQQQKSTAVKYYGKQLQVSLCCWECFLYDICKERKVKVHTKKRSKMMKREDAQVCLPLRAGISRFSILLRVTIRANSSSLTFSLNNVLPRMICRLGITMRLTSTWEIKTYPVTSRMSWRNPRSRFLSWSQVNSRFPST